MKRLALIAALILLTASQARAAEPVPGSSCAGQNANSFEWAGGPENGGVTNGMFCNGGTNLWTGAINFQSTGNVGIGTTSPGALLDVGNATTTLGTMRLEGNTSGYVQIQPAAAAGSWTATLPNTAGTSGYVLSTDGSGNLSWISNAGTASTALSGLTAAAATHTIANTNFAQTWTWDTLAGASALSLTSASTAAASNAQIMLNIALSGANGTSNQKTYGAKISNTHTGTSSTNIGLYATASGGTNNYAAIFAAGNVGIGTTSPASPLTVAGSASSTIQVLGTAGISNNVDSSIVMYGYATNAPTVQINAQDDGGGGTNLNLATNGATGVGGTGLTVFNNGNVGILTTNSSSPLSIGGSSTSTLQLVGTSGVSNAVGSTLVLDGYGTSGLNVQINAKDNGVGGTDMNLLTNGSTRLTILNGGNVGIGTTSPSTTLDVNGYIRSTNFAALTADFTDANAAGLQAITGLSFTLPADAALNVPFECELMYSQATMVSDSFGIGLVTYAPTRIDAEGVINTAAAGTQASAALTNLTTTTPTAIVSGTPGVTNTVYFVRLTGLVQNAWNGGTNTLNFYVSQATAADVVKVKAGSWCRIW